MDQKGPDDGAEVVKVQPVEQQDGLEHGANEHGGADVREGENEVAADAGADVDADVLGVYEDDDENEGTAELETEE